MKTIALFFGMLALTFLLPVGQGAFANQGNRTVTIEPFEFEVDSPCKLGEDGEATAEDILVTGFLKIEEISVSTPSGQGITIQRITGRGTGTGEETGASYRVQVVEAEHEIEMKDGRESESSVFMIRVSSPTEPNFVLLIREMENPQGRDFEIEHAVCSQEGPVPVD
jgi:hypothetical protein